MNGKMWVERQWCPTLQRVNDEAIMALFMKISGMTKGKLEKLNYIRLFLRIITVADITNEQGTIISGHRFSGKASKLITQMANYPSTPTTLSHDVSIST
jgi:cytoskeletal protein CcmA (bactofilin family)